MRIGVSGLGSIGTRHARLLARMRGVELTGFDACGVTERVRTEVGDSMNVADSFEHLLECSPDGLVVATPDAFHLEQADAALAAGIPVLVEKPLSNDVDAAREFASRASAESVPVLVGYVMRYHSTMRRLDRVIRRGLVGTPVSFHASLSAYETLVVARNRFTPDMRYSLVYDYSHEFDYLQWLLGPVAACAASAMTADGVEPSQTPNVVGSVLELESGVVGTVHLDYVASGSRRCRIVGTEGVVDADVGAGTVRVVRSGADEVVDQEREERDAAFVRQLEHFLAVSRGDEAPIVDAADGVRAISVSAALVAACEGRRWVDVRRR